MDAVALIEMLPDTIKLDIVDFQTVKMKDGGVGTRVVLDRILTDTEKAQMVSERFKGLDCVAYHRYAPEIKRSYFYIV